MSVQAAFAERDALKARVERLEGLAREVTSYYQRGLETKAMTGITFAAHVHELDNRIKALRAEVFQQHRCPDCGEVYDCVRYGDECSMDYEMRCSPCAEAFAGKEPE